MGKRPETPFAESGSFAVRAAEQTVTATALELPTDLCAGPHLDSTGRIKGNAIKLTSATGAYWRGDSNREELMAAGAEHIVDNAEDMLKALL